MSAMSAEFHSVHPTAIQNAIGGTHHHTPQSIFQHTMNQTPQQNEQWLRMPQVPPMSMPWSIPAFQQPDLIRFHGEVPVIHKKRKLAPDVIDTFRRPAKQFITEEKMAQHFQGLHISPNMQGAQDPGPSTSSAGPSIVSSDRGGCNILNELEMDENNTQPRLIMSDELKKLQQEPILPSSLLSKLERPSMALVLWEPPSRHLRMLTVPRDSPTPVPSGDSNNNNNNNNNENNSDNNFNNNNESIPNLNQTMDVNINDPNLEPMDL